MARHFSYRSVTCYLTPEMWRELDDVLAHEGHASQSAVLRQLLAYGLAVWRKKQALIYGGQREGRSVERGG